MSGTQKKQAWRLCAVLLSGSLVTMCCSACKGNQDKPVYPVHGQVLFQNTPSGEYTLTFLWMTPVPGDEEREFDRLRGKYSNPKTSPFQAQVKDDPAGNGLPVINLE
jgi:hypothetical protein